MSDQRALTHNIIYLGKINTEISAFFVIKLEKMIDQTVLFSLRCINRPPVVKWPISRVYFLILFLSALRLASSGGRAAHRRITVRQPPSSDSETPHFFSSHFTVPTSRHGECDVKWNVANVSTLKMKQREAGGKSRSCLSDFSNLNFVSVFSAACYCLHSFYYCRWKSCRLCPRGLIYIPARKTHNPLPAWL